MAQKTVTKSATKGKVAAKAATKPVAKSFTLKPLAAGNHTLYIPANKPTSGALLFAWSYVAFTLLGLMDGKKVVAKSIFETVNGKRLLSHHADKFTVAEGKVKLTQPGYFALGPNCLDQKRRDISPTGNEVKAVLQALSAPSSGCVSYSFTL